MAPPALDYGRGRPNESHALQGGSVALAGIAFGDASRDPRGVGGSRFHRPNCGAGTQAVTTKSLGVYQPTFVGPAATGCAVDCHLLSGPVNTPPPGLKHPARLWPLRVWEARPGPCHAVAGSGGSATDPRFRSSAGPRSTPTAPPNPLPSVSCSAVGLGCNRISTSAGGATSVKGLNAVDSASLATNPLGDIEPPDQGLCAGNGFVVRDQQHRGDPVLLTPP